MIAAGDDLDHGITPQRGQRLFQRDDGAFQKEGVLTSAIDVKLTGQLWTERFPIPFQNESDVITLPTLGHFGVDDAGLPVPERFRVRALPARAESGLERLELSTMAHDD